MAKNYSKEARLSKIYAESIVGRAQFASLLYLLGGVILFCLAALFAWTYLELDYVTETIAILAVVAIGAVIFLYGLAIMFYKVGRRPKYYRIAVDNVRMRIRNAKQRIKVAKSKKNKRAVQREKILIRDLKRRIPVLKKFFKTNRFAKNGYTALKFRRVKKIMLRKQKCFARFFSLIMVAIFGFAVYYTSKLDSNTGFTAILEENYSQYMLYAVLAGVVFHFLGGIVAGSIPCIKFQDHENTYIHSKAIRLIDEDDSAMNVYPEPMLDMGSIQASFPKRWDNSSAILEEWPREHGVGMFFLRNLVQVCFTLIFATLYVYMYPALHKLTEIAVEAPFDMLLQVMKWLVFAFMVGFICHSFSAKEYDFECMDEDLQKWRARHTIFVILFFIVVVAYFVLILIAGVKDCLYDYYAPGFIESAIEQFAATFDNSYAVSMGEQWAESYVGDVFTRIVVCLISGCLFAISAFLSDLIIIPRDKVSKRDDFFAFSNRYKDVPKDDTEL